MKFNKVVVVGELTLNKEYQKELDKNITKKITIADLASGNKELADADALFVGFGVKIGKNIIDSAPRLKYIGVYATAFGSIDINYAKSKNIAVCNVGGYSTEAVSEFVFATLLESMRNIGRARKRISENDINFIPEELAKNRELKDKVFGVLGTGKIGSRVAQIALGFGCNVLYWSRNRKKELESKGIKYEDADSIISKADILTLHFSVNDDTKNFLNSTRIKNIKNGAILISTVGWDDLIDINALEERLKKNDITFIIEANEDSGAHVKRFSKYSNCIMYPPVTLTAESLVLRQQIFVDNVANFLKDKPTNKVN
ncbi:MAG: 2-hydroxyacid dehydrogenase [Candidatus Micrarchaeales archaeon]